MRIHACRILARLRVDFSRAEGLRTDRRLFLHGTCCRLVGRRLIVWRLGDDRFRLRGRSRGFVSRRQCAKQIGCTLQWDVRIQCFGGTRPVDCRQIVQVIVDCVLSEGGQRRGVPRRLPEDAANIPQDVVQIVAAIDPGRKRGRRR